MKLEEIMIMWAVDSKLDWSAPDKASIDIPAMHNKYLKQHTNSRMLWRKKKKEYKELELTMTQYYQGDLNHKEDLEELGLEPFQRKLGTKGNFEKYMNGDERLMEAALKLGYLEEKIDYCATVMKQINNMSFNLNNFIKWQIFTNGSG